MSRSRRSGLRALHALRGQALAAALASGACQPQQPAEQPAPAPTPILRFEGDVQLRNGSALRYMAIIVADPARSRGFIGTIDIPAQALAAAPLEGIRFAPGQHIAFELAAPGTPSWVADYDTDGTLRCRFTQAEVTLPCTMQQVTSRAVAVAPPQQRPQTPAPPFPYISEDVRYFGGAGQVSLSGTLSVPSGPGPHPALLIVSDAGVQDRDGTHHRHKPWLVLADHLARGGVAVLRVDDRGAGSSEAGAPGATIADLVADVQAGLAWLAARPEIDRARIGLLGHGFGALIASRAAGSAAHVVLLAPGGVSGSALLARQLELQALQRGASESDARAVAGDASEALVLLAAEPSPERRRARFLGPLEATEEDSLERKAQASEMAELLERFDSPGYVDFIRDDPAPSYAALRCPVLVLVPEHDREVDPAQSWPPLRAAFARSPAATLESLPGLNHWLQRSRSGDPDEYGEIDESFAPQALARIAAWVERGGR